MVWVKTGGQWSQHKKKDIGMLSPSEIKRRRDSFNRKKETIAFKKWRRNKFKQQKGICYLCETPMLGIYSVDHIKPLALGGTSAYPNLALCHLRCNRRKGINTKR